MSQQSIRTSASHTFLKKTGCWGVGTYIIHNAKDEQERHEEIKSADYFRQQFVEGNEEYTAHVVIADNTRVFLKTLRFTFKEKYFVKGTLHRPVAPGIEVDHNHFKSTFEKILLSMGFQGICCFNYKIVDNHLMIFEVNPRYGASMTRFVDEALLS